MKRIAYLLLAVLFFACKKQPPALNSPSSISNLQAEPRVGGVLLKWNVPADSNYLYLEVRYTKKGQVVTTKVSKYTDSVLVDGLLNKLEYTFEVQPFNAEPKGAVGGQTLTTPAVRPIRRPIETTYFPDQVTKIDGITANMLETYTQESSEGPKTNLVDGNINTYWHSAWSSNVAPLPHWIKINFGAPTKMGAFKYYFRQNNNDAGGRPNQFAIETSEDGVTWQRQWTSQPNLPVTPATEQKSQNFDKNYTSKYFRLMILANPGNKSYTHLGEIAFYTMKEELVDAELEAEKNY